MKAKKILALLLAVIMVVALVACGGGGNKPEPTPEEKTCVIYCPNPLETLNLYSVVGYPSGHVCHCIYDPMLWLAEDGSYEPCLAESWDVSEDGLETTFHLVKNAKFHDGTPVTAEDVKFTYEWCQNFPAGKKPTAMVDHVEVLDEYTVKIVCSYIDPIFMEYVAGMGIFSKNYVENKATDPEMKMEECGSGPYKLTETDGTAHAYLEANEDYWRGAPAIKKLEFRYISESSSASVAFENGEISVLEAPIAQGQILADSGKFNFQKVAMKHTAIIALNCQKAPFDNKLVRQAFTLAMNKDDIITVAYDGQAVPARIQANPDSCWGVDFSKAPDMSYNPERAKELLAEAGYPNGLDLTAMGITFKTIAGGYHEKVAQVYQQQLKEIGVNVEIIATETPDEDCVAGDFVIMNEGLSFRTDFAFNKNQYTSAGFGGSNFNWFSDPWLDEAFEEANKLTDRDARAEAYKDIIAFIVDACPGIPYMHRMGIYLFQKDLVVPQFYSTNGSSYRPWEWSWAN